MKTGDKNIEEQIEAYIFNSMSKKELAVFEKLLAKDTKLREEVLLEKSIYESLNDKKWSNIKNDAKNKKLQQLKKQLRSDDFQQLANTIKSVEENYFNKKDTSKQRFNRKYLYLTGTVALIFFLFSIVFNSSKTDYYKQYANWENLPSLTEKGTDKNVIVKGEILYKEKKYEELILLFNSKITREDTYYSYALIYQGSSYFKMGKFDKAHQKFDELTQTNSLQKSYGYWYKLLIYMKNKDKVNINKMMELILKNKSNYNYKKVVILTKKLH